jgi:hypothetical protein
MARYLARACPHCNDYLSIIIREPGRNVPLEAVNGHCLGCSYRIAWIVIRGKASFMRARSATHTQFWQNGPENKLSGQEQVDYNYRPD